MHEPCCKRDSRDVHWGGFVPNVVLPRAGAQKTVAAGVNVDARMAVRRNFALWVSLPIDGPTGPFAELTFVRSGADDVVIRLGGLPLGRVLLAEDAETILVTSGGSGTILWTEDMSSQERGDP